MMQVLHSCEHVLASWMHHFTNEKPQRLISIEFAEGFFFSCILAGGVLQSSCILLLQYVSPNGNEC